MSDVYDKKTRSEVMKQVKSKGNKSTELKLISIFKDNNIKGWRRGYKAKGHPDFVFLPARIAVFTDGCFWHGHDCRNTKPSSNKEYWDKKIGRNMERDREITELYQSRGWTVIRIWECEIKNKTLDEKLNIIAESLKQ